MWDALKWTRTTDEHGTHAALSGTFSEDTDLGPLLEDLQGEVTLDLAEVRSINSCGVREWMRFIRALSARAADHPRALLSGVRDGDEPDRQLHRRAKVRSMMAPYLCAACNRAKVEQLSTAELKKHSDGRQVLCECGVPMELDVFPETYFDFLSAVDPA